MRFDPVSGLGLLCIGDPHVAATPPGQRLPGYREQILDKLRACLDRAAEIRAVPVILGDLFHWPRENANSLVVDLIEMFRPHRPFVLVGNHDKYQARFTRDVSMAVLDAAGVIRLMDEAGPQFLLNTPSGRALVGASPDAAPLPASFPRDPEGPDAVVWLTHHNIAFPEFEDRQYRVREIPGVDAVINGHIHRPQTTLRTGATTWFNPGNITRLTFTRHSQNRTPRAHLWRPGADELEPWTIPHLPFAAVFPDQDFPPEEQETEGESLFLQGLERLAWRRTAEGSGLRQFLQANLNPDRPETALVWELYEEAIRGENI